VNSVKRSLRTGGIVAGLAAYAWWGGLPLYLILVGEAGPWEIVGARIFFSLVFCLVILAVTRELISTFRALRSKKVAGLTAIAGVLIFVNWLVYIIASLTGHVVEASLGYFINPLITVLLGVLVLGEKLRPLQWAALGFAAIAVVILVVGYGQFPWLAFILAGTFGLYGFVKNRVGSKLSATASLTLETAWLLPVAIGILVWESVNGVLASATDPAFFLLIALAGPVTAIPLLLFGLAASRVPLAWMGFMQYVSPTIQLLVGVVILHEPMPLQRLLGFVLVWIGLVVLAIDVIRAERQSVSPLIS
jgi:chloramphenicol-sensitive protein RarD